QSSCSALTPLAAPPSRCGDVGPRGSLRRRAWRGGRAGAGGGGAARGRRGAGPARAAGGDRAARRRGRRRRGGARPALAGRTVGAGGGGGGRVGGQDRGQAGRVVQVLRQRHEGGQGRARGRRAPGRRAGGGVARGEGRAGAPGRGAVIGARGGLGAPRLRRRRGGARGGRLTAAAPACEGRGPGAPGASSRVGRRGAAAPAARLRPESFRPGPAPRARARVWPIGGEVGSESRVSRNSPCRTLGCNSTDEG
ncbi:unnamed protein product, partial [Prorocentrum cordatum]